MKHGSTIMNLKAKDPPWSDELQAATRVWLKGMPRSFYEGGIYALIKRWTAVVEKGGDYIEG